MQLNLFITQAEAWEKFIDAVVDANERYHGLVKNNWLYQWGQPLGDSKPPIKAAEIIRRDRDEMIAFKQLQKDLKIAV